MELTDEKIKEIESKYDDWQTGAEYGGNAFGLMKGWVGASFLLVVDFPLLLKEIKRLRNL